MSVTDDLLAFDAQLSALDFRFELDRLPIWPFVRVGLYLRATSQAQALELPHAGSQKRTLRQKTDFILRSAFLNPLQVRRNFDIVIFGSSAGVSVEREGRWFDRINDYFAMEYPEQTLVVDAAYRGIYKHPRFPPHVRCRDGFALAAAARGRLWGASAADRTAIRRLIDWLKVRFPVSLGTEYYDEVERGLVGFAGQLPLLRTFYQRFFERVHPKLLFVEDGSSGGMSHILSWAHARGIVTGEFQHGQNDPTNSAYNLGPGLLTNDEFSNLRPRYLLLYGRAFCERVRTGSQSVVIGNPHFDSRARAFRSLPRPPAQKVLVVSQGTHTHVLVALTGELARRCPDRLFMFRLHPGEVPFRERYQRLEGIPNVEISTRGDIYDCLAVASAVVGHSSTTLFEAVGLGLPAFIYQDEASRLMVPDGLGEWFTSVDDLISLLLSPRLPSSGDAYFAGDWQSRYREFVASVGAVPR